MDLHTYFLEIVQEGWCFISGLPEQGVFHLTAADAPCDGRH